MNRFHHPISPPAGPIPAPPAHPRLRPPSPALALLSAFILLLPLSTPPTAAAVVVNFDDLITDLDLTGSGYGGLTWEVGGAGLNGNTGYWVVSRPAAHNYPYSSPHNVINAWGATEIGIAFPTSVNVQGAYIAGQGDATWTTGISVDGYLGNQLVASTAAFTDVDATPSWFAMNLGNVDRIVFHSVPTYFGGGIFGMDDLTYTPVPEPLILPLAGLLAAAVLRRRSRREGGGR